MLPGFKFVKSPSHKSQPAVDSSLPVLRGNHVTLSHHFLHSEELDLRRNSNEQNPYQTPQSGKRLSDAAVILIQLLFIPIEEESNGCVGSNPARLPILGIP